jgi:4-amino-4-deoxy-L-arabinose transferase-like glycosyltransferase
VQTHFQTQDLVLLSCSGALLFFALLLFVHRRMTAAVVLLTLTAFLLRLTFVLTDPFVYDWDEQFHALVARNMTAHPFTPVLYQEPLLPYDISEWDRNHIWLHKQPLFLWLIALSLKTVGFTPFAVKLPSLLLSVLMVPAIYRIGKLLYTAATGFYAALLFAVGYVFINVVTGNVNTDHNDVIFSAFVLFSIWAFCEYAVEGKQRMRWLIGFLAGCAVLVKWLPGLLVFGGWGLWLLLSPKHRRTQKSWIDLLLAAGITAAVVLPWQIYIHNAFPAESAYELRYSALHFTIPIEAHGGPWNYHLQQLADNFGYVFSIVFALGWLLLLIVTKQRTAALSVFTMLLVFFVFYALAATKMPLFTLPVYPLLLLGGAALFDMLLRSVVEHKVRGYLVAMPLLILLSWFSLQFSLLEERHTSLAGENSFRALRIHDRQQSYALAQELGSGKWAVFGLQPAVAFNFYTGIPAYRFKPESNRMQELMKQGWKIAVYDPAIKDTLPEGVYRITRKFREE